MTCRRAAELISWELDTDLPLHWRAGLGQEAGCFPRVTRVCVTLATVVWPLPTRSALSEGGNPPQNHAISAVMMELGGLVCASRIEK